MAVLSTILTNSVSWNEKAFALRKSVFEQKYDVEFPEADNDFSGETWWVLGLDEDENVIATIRLLHDAKNQKSDFKLRISKTYELPYPDHECLELASVFCKPEYRESTISNRMALELFAFIRKNKFKYICGIVDADFAAQFTGKGLFSRVVNNLRVSDQPIWNEEYGIYRHEIGADIRSEFLTG